MQIIPAIDIRGGRCVRLQQGDYEAETVFSNDPTAMAAHWASLGAERLHVVDLDGARQGQPGNLDSVRAIVRSLEIPCQFGGGVRSTELVAQLLDMGMDRVVVGTRAFTDRRWLESLCREFPHRICLGLDARDGKVATEGWTRTSTVVAADLAQELDALPLAATIYTDIGRDGMMRGANLDAIRELVERVRTPVIASGGISTLDDVRALAAMPLAGCIVGRALYEGRVLLPDAIRAARDMP